MKFLFNLPGWCTAVALGAALTFTGCKKDNIAPATESAQAEEAATLDAAQSEAESDVIFDDVFNINGSINAGVAGEDLGFGGDFSGNIMGGRDINSPDSASRCFTVTVVPAIPHVFPKTVTVDFGSGCLGRDGKYRKGKIVSIYTAPMRIPGSKVSTTLVDYYVDSFKVEGTHITENTSTSNMQGWKVTVLDAKISNTNNNRWRKWNSLKSVTQIEGNGTPAFPLDDVFKITGGARGSNAAGHTWTTTIQEPLIKKFTCRWLVKGTLKLTRDSHEALLDYGNGNCDNQAVITINGIPHPITL